MKIKKCKHCGKVLLNTRQTYCGSVCQDKAKRKRNKLKDGGITEKKLDDLWSLKVRDRDKKCMYCNSTSYLNAHHIYSRSNHSTRWDIDNGITLCSGCHTFSNKFSAHKTGIEFAEWITNYMGKEFIDKLRTKAHTVNTKTKQEWWEILNNDII